VAAKRKTKSRVDRPAPKPASPRKRASAAAQTFPILEHDPSRRAIIEPRQIFSVRSARHTRANFPRHCVLCFFQDVIDDLVRTGAAEIATYQSEGGPHPVYEIDFGARRLAVAHPRVGAPMAASMLEYLIALGARKFMACGGAGVLDHGFALGHEIVPTAAVRDEGTFYHYLPPAREVAMDKRALAAIERTLARNGVDYITAKTWTTDGLYRETPAKVRARRAEGCLTVEMEAAAFFAVAQFRRVRFGQILYAGDKVVGKWDDRGWMRHQGRERLFTLAAEACLAL
jgi:uridine phosphorylase